MFDCKNNFQHQFQNELCCRICKETNSVEDHLLNCKQLSDDEHDVQFSDVYGGVDQQLKAVKSFQNKFKVR